MLQVMHFLMPDANLMYHATVQVDMFHASVCVSAQTTRTHVCSAAKRQEYSIYESEIYETLTSLVKDASTLRVYLAAAMQVEAETFILATA